MSLSTRLTATSDLQLTLYEIFDATIELQGPDWGFFSSTTTETLKIDPIAASIRPSWITSQLSMLPQSTAIAFKALASSGRR